MYCHECGAETATHHSFCRACGTELSYQSADADADGDVAGQSAEASTSSPEREGPRPEQDATDESTRPDDGRTADAPSDAGGGEDGGAEASEAGLQWPAVEERRDQAFSALFGYAFLVLLRITGISGVLFVPRATNPLLFSPLHDIGVFLFYDGFWLVLLAFVSSAYLTARGYTDLEVPEEHRDTLDTLATIGLGGASLLIVIGVLGAL